MKIMVCYDSSKEADAAVGEAASYAKRLDGTVTIVTSIRAEGEESRTALEGLERARRAFDQCGIPCATKLLARDLYAGEDLVLFATENRMDLVVLGVKNRSKLGKLLLGSVTQHVMLSAPCPVLGVK